MDPQKNLIKQIVGKPIVEDADDDQDDKRPFASIWQDVEMDGGLTIVFGRKSCEKIIAYLQDPTPENAILVAEVVRDGISN